MTTPSEIEELDGVLRGPHRRPVNPGQGAAGSIHNDEVAAKLGFRGGTIAGSIHMEQFPPLLLRAFGRRWFETGSLSLYFTNATLHREPVRCLLRRPAPEDDDAQVEVWMEHESGMRVCEGTASVGSPAQPSALRSRLANLRPPGDVRILRALEPELPMGPVPSRVAAEEQRRRLKRITEPLDLYEGGSPWGGPVATPNMMVRALRAPEATLRLDRGGAVGLFGAIEIRNLAGPVFVERDYTATGEVVAVGETPKSEYYWYESRIEEPESGSPVASMIMMLRFMKASSPLWA